MYTMWYFDYIAIENWLPPNHLEINLQSHLCLLKSQLVEIRGQAAGISSLLPGTKQDSKQTCRSFYFILFLYFTILYWLCHNWLESTVSDMYFPFWIPLPPPSPPPPSGSSQCTSPEHPVSCIKPGLAICFIYHILHVSMRFSHIISPSHSPRVQKAVLYICVSFSVLHIGLSLTSF